MCTSMAEAIVIVVVGLAEDLVLCLVRWREVMQIERRKRVMTMSEPTRIPITTHSRSPNIDVGFESSEFTNAASYTDIFSFWVGFFWLSFEGFYEASFWGETREMS